LEILERDPNSRSKSDFCILSSEAGVRHFRLPDFHYCRYHIERRPAEVSMDSPSRQNIVWFTWVKEKVGGGMVSLIRSLYRSIIYYLSMVLHSLFPKKQMVTQKESSNAMKRSTKEAMMDVLIERLMKVAVTKRETKHDKEGDSEGYMVGSRGGRTSMSRRLLEGH